MGKGKGWHGNTERHRRAAIKGLIKAGKRPSIFFEGGSPMYSKIVTFKSPGTARLAVAQLLDEFGGAMTRTKHRRVARVTRLAANRADIMAKNKNLKPNTRERMRAVWSIYNNAASTMKREFSRMYGEQK